MKKTNMFIGLFWVIILVLMINLAFVNNTLVKTNNDLIWCNEEIESNIMSIKQCIQDEQGTVEECFNNDWPEIEALYR